MSTRFRERKRAQEKRICQTTMLLREGGVGPPFSRHAVRRGRDNKKKETASKFHFQTTRQFGCPVTAKNSAVIIDPKKAFQCARSLIDREWAKRVLSSETKKMEKGESESVRPRGKKGERGGGKGFSRKHRFARSIRRWSKHLAGGGSGGGRGPGKAKRG